MPSITLRKAVNALKFAVALAVTASALVAIQALSATESRKPRATTSKAHVARTHRAFKAQTNDDGTPARPQVLTMIGATRTVTAEPDWAGTDWEDNGTDSVELTCPAGRTAISGGFQAPDSAGVLLNGSHPGSSPDKWVIEITYIGDGHPANWIPNVTCF